MAIIIPGIISGTGTTGPVQTLTETVKNTSGGTLLKGTPVRITGATGQEADVGPADASNAFPANFVLAETLAAGESGQAVALGFINNVSVPNASLFTAGQEVWLAVGGGWTTTRPTGAANVQLLGNIVKVNTGANTISGIFAPQNIEYLPNLAQGKVWVGNASGLPEEATLGQSPEVITTPTGIIYRFTQSTKPTQRAPGVSLGVGDQWENSGDGTEWLWNGTYWISKNVYPVSIASVYGNSSNLQVIRGESIPSNKGLLVTELVSQIAVSNANPTSTNYWTANVSLSGVSVATLSTQNATTYPHSSTTPNIVIPARSAIPLGVTLTATPLEQTTRQWYGMTTLGTNVYASVVDGDIYKQTNGIGNFVALGQTSRSWRGMTTLGTDVYACVFNGDIYKQTNGVGNFIALGQTGRDWHAMTTLGTDVYACVFNGDIYKQTNGVGNFIALGQTSRLWYGMTTLGTDVYACVDNGDIYKQTNGVGNFIALGQTSREWRGMTTLGTDVYACVLNGDIYKQTNGVGNFVALGQTSRGWFGMTTLGTDVYACVLNGDIYRLIAAGGTSIGHSLEVTLNRFGSVSLPYAAIALKCQEIHP